MQISAKARLVSLIVALVFMAGTLIGSGTYLIINYINKSNALSGSYTLIGDIIDANDKSQVNVDTYNTLMNRLGSRTGGATTLENGGSAIVFTMAGRDWQVVYRDPANADIITIWMTEPYASARFAGSSDKYNGSEIQNLVNNFYNTMLNTYLAMSSFVRTPNQMTQTYKNAQAQNGTYDGLTSYQGALGGSENFWLPSLYEAFSLWGLDNNDRGFDDTNVASYCWLRSGYFNGNDYAMLVRFSGSADYYSARSSYGVRPAAHISLSALEDAAKPSYTISVTSNNTGYGTVSTNGGTYIEGSTLSVTATPNPNYQFVCWERNGVQVSTSPTYEITVSGNDTYTAVFEPIMYTVTTDVNIAEAGTVSGGGSYQQGTQATLTANLTNSNYKFVGWDTTGDNVVDISATTNPYRFTVTGNALVTAIFEKLPTITITTNSENYGKILYNNTLITSTQVIQDSGTQITNIYAIPVGGYAFLYWEDSQGFRSTANPLTYTISADTTLTAVFGKSVDGVVVTASTGGEARIVGFDDTTIKDNDTVTLIAVTYTGYTFAGWYIDGELLNADYGTSAQIRYGEIKDKVVTAIFTPISNLGDMNSQTDNGQTDDFI